MTSRQPLDDIDDKVARGFPVTHAEALVLCDRITRLETAIKRLVELKDGPRDEYYRKHKEEAWKQAREVL